MSRIAKPLRVVAGVSDAVLRKVISSLAKRRDVEVLFSNETRSIVRLSQEKLPSVAIVDLASSEYDAFDCCHELEWHPEVIVFCLYPENRKDLLNKAYEYGLDSGAESSRLAERLSEILDGTSDNYKSRKWRGEC